MEKLLEEPEKGNKKLYRALRKAFAELALRDSQALRGRKIRVNVFDRRATLTPATVRLTEECIKLRLRYVRFKSREPGVTWPPTAAARRADRRHRAAPPRRPFGRWHEQYNAACLYALPLLVEGLSVTEADEFAESAVARLEAAMAHADSAYIASRRDWLVGEDPDLRGLRATRQFAEFEVMHLPSASITPRRPANVQQLESSRYMRSLLTTAAEQWRAVWRERRAAINGGPDLQHLLEWFGDELRAWEADPHCRVPRLPLRNAAGADPEPPGRRTASRPAAARVRVPALRARAARRCACPQGPCDDAAHKEIGAADERLKKICAIVGERADARTAVLAGLETLAGHAAAAPTLPRSAPRRRTCERLCDHHAALWQLLGEWIEAGETSAERREREFRSAVARRGRCGAAGAP